MAKQLTLNDLPSTLPQIPPHEPTIEQLHAEAALMGDSFVPVSANVADLVADADEMLGAQEDLSELRGRGYPITAGMLVRIKRLRDVLAPVAARREQMQAMSSAAVAQAESARKELLQIRRELAAIARAAGLPASLFSLESNRSNRLNVVMMRLDEILTHVGALHERLPDQQRVDALTVRARQRIDEQRETRAAAKLMTADTGLETKTQRRLERLLFDAMVYVSAQGLAAYPDDPMREKRYRLDHVYGRRASRVADPGAGGTEGVPPPAETDTI